MKKFFLLFLVIVLAILSGCLDAAPNSGDYVSLKDCGVISVNLDDESATNNEYTEADTCFYESALKCEPAKVKADIFAENNLISSIYQEVRGFNEEGSCMVYSKVMKLDMFPSLNNTDMICYVPENLVVDYTEGKIGYNERGELPFPCEGTMYEALKLMYSAQSMDIFSSN